MYNETSFGGRYFTVKKSYENGVELLHISVSDVIESIKETIKTGTPRVKKLDEYLKAQDFKKLMVEFSNYLVISASNLGIKRIGKFDIDLKLVNWDKDFTYEYTVKVNDLTKILSLKVKKYGWSKEFVEAFIADYNNRI